MTDEQPLVPRYIRLAAIQQKLMVCLGMSHDTAVEMAEELLSLAEARMSENSVQTT